jgi:hypothetical protein
MSLRDRSAFMRDGYGFLKDRYWISGLVVGLVIFLVAIVGVVTGIEAHECRVAGREYGRATAFHFTGGGCYIQIEPGVKIQLSQFEAFKGVR